MGRDIGTVVAPEAELKIFLHRRRGPSVRAGAPLSSAADPATVLAEQTMRDQRATARAKHSPLRARRGAVHARHHRPHDRRGHRPDRGAPSTLSRGWRISPDVGGRPVILNWMKVAIVGYPNGASPRRSTASRGPARRSCTSARESPATARSSTASGTGAGFTLIDTGGVDFEDEVPLAGRSATRRARGSPTRRSRCSLSTAAPARARATRRWPTCCAAPGCRRSSPPTSATASRDLPLAADSTASGWVSRCRCPRPGPRLRRSARPHRRAAARGDSSPRTTPCASP